MWRSCCRSLRCHAFKQFKATHCKCELVVMVLFLILVSGLVCVARFPLAVRYIGATWHLCFLWLGGMCGCVCVCV